MANPGVGIGLIVFGFLIAIGGGVAWSSCSSTPAIGGMGPDCTGFEVPVFLGIVLIVIGAIVLGVQFRPRTTRIQQVPDPSVPPPMIRPVVIQQTVEREVVKVRCRYCGNLCEVTAKACPSCGAPLG